MNRVIPIAAIALVAVMMGMSAIAPAIADKPGTVNEDKVVICHFPPGNPDNPQTISISEDDVQEHIDKHGDFIVDFENRCPPLVE